MRSDCPKKMLWVGVFAVNLLLTANVASAANVTTVNLTAQRTHTVMPDGSRVPMWGYCKTGSCSNAWMPGPTIIVPYDPNDPAGSALTINLTNRLPTETSIVILGQLGGGIGSPVKVAGPVHAPQTTTTWPNITPANFTPPPQPPRVQSFAPEASANGGTQTYAWTALKPGTYIYETGTHPSIQAPMGLYGILVVTKPPLVGPVSGATPFPASEFYTKNIQSGAPALIQKRNNFWGGVLTQKKSVTPAAPLPLAIFEPGVAFQNLTYDADVTMLFSEVDPVQNAAVDALAAPLCSASVCSGVIDESRYPAAVNYTPTYFLINGQAYDQAAPQRSAFPVIDAAYNGNVMLRYANAGLRTHIPVLPGLDVSLIAEDGNLAPGNPKVQSEVLLSAGKTYDALVKPESYASQSSYAAAGATVTNYKPTTYAVFDRQLSLSTANLPNGGMHGFIQVGNSELPAAVIPTAVNDLFSTPYGAAFNGNVTTNDIAVYGAAAISKPAHGTLVFNADGTFVYTPNAGYQGVDSFVYRGNPTAASPDGTTNAALVTFKIATLGLAPTAAADAYTSNVATLLKVARPGVLGNDVDPTGYPLKAQADPAKPLPAWVKLNADGSFTATPPAPGTYTFNYVAVNSQGTASNSAAVTMTFRAPSGVLLSVVDAQVQTTKITDYRWTIEEDTTFHTPAGQTPAYAPGTPPPPSLATSFHKSFMPVVATGCTGPVSCGQGQAYNGVAVTTLQPQTTVDQVYLDPTKYYYVSILPGDGANAFTPTAPTTAGHTMGGVAITPANITAAAGTPAKTVTALLEPSPLQPAQISVYIFEDNNPTNNDPDAGEPGLGGFQIIVVDVAGRTGDPIGQITYDAFNMPLTNALLGTPGCPDNTLAANKLVGVVYTCPDGIDPATGAQYALAGQALIKNLMPGRYDVIAHPGAERAAKGEVWYQVSTLEGTPGQDAFAKVGEPTYFQEFGPPGFHTFIGFANPAHINAVNAKLGGTNTVTGTITNLHMSRPIEETMWDSGSRAALAHTTCFVGLNQVTGGTQDIAFAQCDANGNFTLNNVPPGDYQIVAWDQWLDQIIAFKALTVPAGSKNTTVAMGNVPVFNWFTRVEQSAYMDLNRNGIRDPGEPGIPQIPTTIRFRDGSISNLAFGDSNGYSVFNELFPLFNWYVTESDTTRFKGTGVNVTVDAGGKPDASGPYAGILNSTFATVPAVLPPCPATGPFTAPCNPTSNPKSTNRIDPGATLEEGLMGFIGQTQKIDWGKIPYEPGENGGIQGLVVYYSTRPFDDVRFDIQNLWEPLVPRVTVNLYQEVILPDGTMGLQFVESTQTTSWDDFANGVNAAGVPNMQCPGQSATDPYLTYTLGAANQFRCYDGFHGWNQVQPAVYDGAYLFKTGPDGKTPLAPGKYVVEVVPPAGYTIVKEEDKNILIGDAWVAPVTQQFGALSNIFILPDQATIGNANPNNPGQVNPTTNLGVSPGAGKINFPPCVGNLHRVPDYLSLFPAAQQVAPFAGADKPLCDRKEVVLEDQQQSIANFFIYTEAHIASHFSGMILDDAASEVNAASPDFGEKFAVPFVPVSIKDFAGVEISRVYADQWGIFNGLTPSSWQVNVPNPAGYSPNMLITCMNDPGPIIDTRPACTSVGVPAGCSTTSGQKIIDPNYDPSYSNFCYTNPFMPGLTDYLDTPVLPIAAFASGYNPPDCAYPAATPAIKSVNGNGLFGPYIDTSLGTNTLTITGLGDVQVSNPAYQGPSAPVGTIYAQKTILRHYGFGATAGTVTLVDAGGLISYPLTATAWGDQLITATVPTTIPAGTYQLVITTSTGQSSIDTTSVEIENSTTAPLVAGAPGAGTRNKVIYVSQTNPGANFTTIQAAINAANPGDLIMVDAGNYPELVVMWKPVRLQGIGAASVIINAAKYPTNKLANWRPIINNLFGILPTTGNQAATWQVDPLPGQPVTGGIVLLEPSVLSTEEGAGITVLAKGFKADGVTRLTNSAADCSFTTASVDPAVAFNPTSATYAPQPGLSNFLCGASRIDGISVTGGDSGGGIFVNGWAHNLSISNNRVYGNAGAFNGGIRVGVPNLEGPTGAPLAGYGYNVNVRVHHNAITKNATVEAPAVSALAGGGAGGGLSMCSGSDNYMVDHNWVCGNYSASDGGGIGHSGVSVNAKILNNAILFNQSYNQSSTINGGGLTISGESGAAGALTNGTGNVRVDSNLIQGNFAESGHGGGVRVQMANGSEVANNPTNAAGLLDPTGAPLPTWYQVTLTNNVIINNVAGWSGGGVSLADAINVAIVNNTVSNNDSTGIVGPLMTVAGPTTGQPSPAGIVSQTTSAALAKIAGAGNAISNPILQNNVVWHNRSFFFDTPLVNGVATASLCSSNNVADALAHNCIALPPQTVVGVSTGNPAYWDLGVLGDPTPTPGANRLNPTYSILSSLTGYNGAGLSAGDPLFTKPYTNGSRANPGLAFEPGQPFLPPFQMSASATLDEAGNFVDLRYGPLSQTDPLNAAAATTSVYYGNYQIGAGSSAFGTGVTNAYAPNNFSGTARVAPFNIGAY